MPPWCTASAAWRWKARRSILIGVCSRIQICSCQAEAAVMCELGNLQFNHFNDALCELSDVSIGGGGGFSNIIYLWGQCSMGWEPLTWVISWHCTMFMESLDLMLSTVKKKRHKIILESHLLFALKLWKSWADWLSSSLCCLFPSSVHVLCVSSSRWDHAAGHQAPASSGYHRAASSAVCLAVR